MAKKSFIEWTNSESLASLSDHLTGLIRGRLWLQVLIGMVLGLLTGILLGPSVGWVEPRTATIIGNWLAMPGQLFLALIQMIVIPLIIASIIRGLAASGDFEQLRKIGVRVVAYFLVTTAIAITIGLLVTLLIKPGLFIDGELVQKTLASGSSGIPTKTVQKPSLEQLPGLVVTMLPSNPILSMVQGQMLQVVLFSVIVGIALVMMAPSQSKPLLDLFGSLQEVCMTVVRWAMWLAPFAVFGLLAQLTTKIGLQSLLGMSVYVGTVLLGLLILFIGYLTLLYVFTRVGPRRFLKATREALLLAFPPPAPQQSCRYQSRRSRKNSTSGHRSLSLLFRLAQPST